MYWFSTAGPAAASRIYYEAENSPLSATTEALWMGYIPVKLGVSANPREIYQMPLGWSKMLGPIVFSTRHDRGGHFMAWEQPENLVGDLWKMFSKGGGAYGAVEGKSGSYFSSSAAR